MRSESWVTSASTRRTDKTPHQLSDLIGRGIQREMTCLELSNPECLIFESF